MKHYTAKTDQRVREGGMTDLVVVNFSDMIGKSFAANLNLTSLNLLVGDIVQDAMMDITTAIVGPTGPPTGSLGVTGAATQFIAATALNAKAQVCVGSAYVPYIVAATGKFLILALANGSGNGADPTAGEVRCWFKIWRAAERNIQV